MARHKTKASDAAVAGWVALDESQEISVIPVVDTRYALDDGGSVFARLTYAAALKVAKSYDATLPTPEDLEQLRAIGLQLHPYYGTPTAETALRHSRLHDQNVNEQLVALGWDGSQAVAGAGKHWVAGAPAGRSRLMGWDSDGPGPGKAWTQPDSVAHNRGHHDDGTTTMLVRPRSVKYAPMDLPPSSSGEGDTDPAPDSADIYAELDDPPSEVIETITISEHPPIAVRPSPDEALEAMIAEFIESKNYTRVTRGLTSIDWIVLHSTENPIRRGSARNVARWFGGSQAPSASAHYVVGPEEILACVPLTCAAWAAPSANRTGVQIEMLGQALKTMWKGRGLGDRDGYAVLERSAKLVGALLDGPLSHIPDLFLSAQDMVDGKRGITTHDTTRRAIALAKKQDQKRAPFYRADRGKWANTTHRDPGGVNDKRFPKDLFLELVRA